MDLFSAVYSSFCMGIIKIYSFFYLSYWLRLLLVVYGDVESIPGPRSDKRVRVFYSNICGLHANLDELAVAGSDDVLVCAECESKVSDRRHLSEFRIPGFGCHQQGLRNSANGAQGMALYVREGFRSFQQSKLKCSCHESCVFPICSRINNFYVYAFHPNPGHDGSLYYCLLDSMARVQSVNDKAVFVFAVMRMLITLSGWSLSLLLIGTGVMLLIFAICRVVSMQLVRCPTHIAGNRLDLVMTEVPDIVDVFFGTPLGTSDHCFVCCVLRVEQSVLEYHIRSTVFLKHHTNWTMSAVQSGALLVAPF